MTSTNILTSRKREFVKKTFQKFSLNLEGLTVFTEAATGSYLYTPIIAALAGAKQVFAVAADSRYGTKEEVQKSTMRETRELGIDDKISVLFEKDRDCLKKSDIITNSGFVRPITKEMIDCMKPTAVIPLMWETWEFRTDDLDLEACRKKGILVLGTNESYPLLYLFRSNGFLVSKLLFETGMEVYKDKLLLIGSGPTGDSIADFFITNDITFDRVVFDNKIPNYQVGILRSQDEVISLIDSYDAIIVAEHQYDIDILSRTGFISTELLKEKNPSVQIIHICGSVSESDLLEDDLLLHPKNVAPFGHMTVSADYLGFKSTIELNTAGLKVGEVMARCRLKGMSVDESAKYALLNSPADDF